MRLVFMGTPEIARVCLAEVLRQGHEVAGVYTRQDKPVGRKQVLTAPPVKVLAEENEIPVFQPQSLRDAGQVAQLRELAPALIVVVAYGLLLPPQVLDIPQYGCINLHVSLLPQYRGAAPIQWAVIHGEEKTGLTVMQMDEGLDTGPILTQEEIAIGPDTTAGELLEEVAPLGGRLLAETISALEGATIRAVPQKGPSSAAPSLDKTMAQLDFEKAAGRMHNLVRGCNPWPLAWFTHEGKRVQVLRTKKADGRGKPGEVLHTDPLTIACGRGALALLHLKPEGKKAMTGTQWAMGRRLGPGDVLANR
ncbi:methionyl-tRNA formyltransferase [Ruminococcaceae bacterium OttesenSCG-928-I18]|nr:methionyl-tRNA formyltransferase [Ruminococcaceae bacterium OttesenSCG-928-I18]